jgi:hypothetical protein
LSRIADYESAFAYALRVGKACEEMHERTIATRAIITHSREMIVLAAEAQRRGRRQALLGN